MNAIKEICKLPRIYFLPAAQDNNNCVGLYEMMKEISTPDFIMVEIGSFSGISSILFAEMCKTVYCIDPWKDYGELMQHPIKIAEEMFDSWLELYPNIKKIKSDSISASKNFEDNSLDMVYVDGAHDLDSVKADLLAWMPKIKNGGWICGHDIKIDVRIPVEEVIGTKYKTYIDESWAFQIK